MVSIKLKQLTQNYFYRIINKLLIEKVQLSKSRYFRSWIEFYKTVSGNVVITFLWRHFIIL